MARIKSHATARNQTALSFTVIASSLACSAPLRATVSTARMLREMRTWQSSLKNSRASSWPLGRSRAPLKAANARSLAAERAIVSALPQGLGVTQCAAARVVRTAKTPSLRSRAEVNKTVNFHCKPHRSRNKNPSLP